MMCRSAKQHVLHAQVLIMEGTHLAPGIFQHLTQARRNAWLTATIDMRHTLEFGVDDALCFGEIATDFRNHLLYHSLPGQAMQQADARPRPDYGCTVWL